ncbi:beta-1,3-galactosyltransferase 1-like [Oratosquilla oratoria]|uniref:beta-1,3-galactosyltransferase 1-like n=1 Tax=Oratosquilla oratoria TaxID=337810 RepID=UPI003F75C183
MKINNVMATLHHQRLHHLLQLLVALLLILGTTWTCFDLSLVILDSHDRLCLSSDKNKFLYDARRRRVHDEGLDWNDVLEEEILVVGKESFEGEELPELPFRYLLNEPDTCKGGLDIINIVPIDPADIDTRNLIRRLWGNQKYFTVTRMKTVFLLGTFESPFLKEHVLLEHHLFHDIIQADFVDSYYNLTRKTMTSLHWTHTYCSSAKWFLKSDADIFVNPFALSYFLTFQRADFVCRMNTHPEVCRTGTCKNTKWIISEKEYPGKMYPPYCAGPAYVIKTQLVPKLYAAANRKKPFVMEDAYFTGILAKPLNVTFLALPTDSFVLRNRQITQKMFTGRMLLIMGLEDGTSQGKSLKLWSLLTNYLNITVYQHPLL